MVGSHHQPICIPAGSCKFLVGTAKGVPHKGNFMMEGTQDGNLPSGVTVMFGPDKTDKNEETKTKEKEKESDPQTTTKDSADQEPPKFGPCPDTSSADFDFKTELDCLPFTINIGKAPLSRELQSHFIDLIYDYKEVFSLYDGDLGFCDALKHSIPTTTDNPVYLPH